jgi:hypothetical protein
MKYGNVTKLKYTVQIKKKKNTNYSGIDNHVRGIYAITFQIPMIKNSIDPFHLLLSRLSIFFGKCFVFSIEMKYFDFGVSFRGCTVHVCVCVCVCVCII